MGACSGNLLMTAASLRRQRVLRRVGEALLALVGCASVFAVLFIFWFIAKDAFPFMVTRGVRGFFLSAAWYPSGNPAEFGALPIIMGSLMVTLGACVVAVPTGIFAAVALSDMVPFGWRQHVKVAVEILAAIPSVAYGFFALVVLAPLLQGAGGRLPAGLLALVGFPAAALVALVCGERWGGRSKWSRRGLAWVLLALTGGGMWWLVQRLAGVQIASGTNAFTVSLVLGVMALPTIVSVAEDALQSIPREVREGSYALGATRAETLSKVVLPAASSGICVAVMLGVMRALGETMVVWMAAGNAARLPDPWYNFFAPVRTLTATIAGDMGEADHATGSERFSVLFVMALLLLVFSFGINLVSARVMKGKK